MESFKDLYEGDKEGVSSDYIFYWVWEDSSGVGVWSKFIRILYFMYISLLFLSYSALAIIA